MALKRLLLYWFCFVRVTTVNTLDFACQICWDAGTPLYGDQVELRNVHETALRTVNASVESLTVADSNFVNVTSNFANFTNLLRLILTNSSVTAIRKDAFVNLLRLEYLDLSRNNLEYLEPGLLTNQVNLTTLKLHHNRFAYLYQINPLLEIRGLRHLILHSNRIEGNLRFLTRLNGSRLSVLDLSRNRIEWVNDTSFRELKELRELDLSSNNFQNAENLKQALVSLNNSNLKVLRVGNAIPGDINYKNVYRKLDHSFPVLPNLLYLDLTSSDIATIEPSTFRTKLDNLQTLILKDNKLGEIPREIRGTRLTHLDLSKNARDTEFKLEQVDYELDELLRLDVSQNEISHLKSATFQGFPSLVSLNVSYNHISHIIPKAFAGLDNLKTLDLTQNQMNEIVNDTFNNLVEIETLILDRNSLKVYPHNDPFKNLTKLKRLSFRYNSLCEIWWYLLLDQVSLEYLDGRDNKLESWKQRAFVNTVNIKTILLQTNEISKVSQPMLVDLVNVNHVDISDNPFNCSDCDLIQTQNWIMNRTDWTKLDKFKCLDQNRVGARYVYNATLVDQCHQPSNKQSLVLPLSLSAVVFVLVTLTLTYAAYRLRWYTRYYYYIWCVRKGLRHKQQPAINGGYAYDAYVSYSKKDFDWLNQVFLTKLERGRVNLKFYVRDRDSELGRHVVDNILEGMERSRFFVAVVSDNYLKSCWRMWELKLAVCRAVKEYTPNIIVINLDGASENATSASVKNAIVTQVYLQWSEESLKQKVVMEKIVQKLTHLQIPAVQTKL